MSEIYVWFAWGYLAGSAATCLAWWLWNKGKL